ncbi:MAG: response regulator [Cyanobacteriota bacterium]|nr:response regulator [Cyanobacteriota bacterium]
MSNILIAEDEPRLAAFVEKGLRKNGFSTAIARNGEQVLEMLHGGQFDLLLLDLGLPVKDGFAVLRELGDSEVLIPIIVVSAREEARKETLECSNSVKDFVSKPFRFGDLLARVQTHLPPTVA